MSIVTVRSMPFWCVGNPLSDPFGGPVLPKIDSLEVAKLIAEGKQQGLIDATAFHDDDLVPWDPNHLEDDLDPASPVYINGAEGAKPAAHWSRMA